MNNTISFPQFFFGLFLVFIASFSFGVIAGGHVEESLLFKTTYGKEFVIIEKTISENKIPYYKVKADNEKTFGFYSNDELELSDIIIMRKK